MITANDMRIMCPGADTVSMSVSREPAMIRTLSCHCGAIRLETNARLSVVTDCNCSRCARAGMLNWHVDRRKVRLATPRSGLSTYVWRFVDEGLHFCPTCGTAMCK